MFNTIAQKVFGKPRFSKVHLDEMGTFIWPEIDGAKTVQELALLVKEHFGDKGRTALSENRKILSDNGKL